MRPLLIALFAVCGGWAAKTATLFDAISVRDVIGIRSNGTYSADLSNLSNGTITYLMSVTDPAGNVLVLKIVGGMIEIEAARKHQHVRQRCPKSTQ